MKTSVAGSRAEWIEMANRLRRNADRLRREVGSNFAKQVIDVRNGLFSVGMPNEEIFELLPASILRVPPCRLRPINDYVVILPTESAAETKGGLIIPDSAKAVPQEGEVLAIGPGRVEANVGTVVMSVAVGDQVVFGRYAGLEYELDGLRIRMMREEEILGVLAPKDAE